MAFCDLKSFLSICSGVKIKIGITSFDSSHAFINPILSISRKDLWKINIDFFNMVLVIRCIVFYYNWHNNKIFQYLFHTNLLRHNK